jgi:hypothetical protein
MPMTLIKDFSTALRSGRNDNLRLGGKWIEIAAVVLFALLKDSFAMTRCRPLLILISSFRCASPKS